MIKFHRVMYTCDRCGADMSGRGRLRLSHKGEYVHAGLHFGTRQVATFPGRMSWDLCPDCLGHMIDLCRSEIGCTTHVVERRRLL